MIIDPAQASGDRSEWLGLRAAFPHLASGDAGAPLLFHAIGLEPAVPLMIAVGIVEFVGGILIAVGFLTRPAALAAAVTTGTAALAVHLPLGFYVEPGGIEFSGLWAIVLLFIAVRGGGRMSIDALVGREF